MLDKGDPVDANRSFLFPPLGTSTFFSITKASSPRLADCLPRAVYGGGFFSPQCMFFPFCFDRERCTEIFFVRPCELDWVLDDIGLRLLPIIFETPFFVEQYARLFF